MTRLIIPVLIFTLSFGSVKTTASTEATSTAFERSVCSIKLDRKADSKKAFEYLEQCKEGDILYFSLKVGSRAKNALRICELDTLTIYDGGVKGHCVYTGTVLPHVGDNGD